MLNIKAKHLSIFLIALLIGFYTVNFNRAIAAEGQARVYTIDPETTPILKVVTLKDLDRSGLLRNPWLILLIRVPSRYAPFRAYSPQGNFLYAPVKWNYYNIQGEGLKFDQASLYYYYTTARHYFTSHFGFQQSLDGRNIEQLKVVIFHEVKDGSVFGVSGDATCIDVTRLVVICDVPGDPYKAVPYPDYPGFFPNLYRTFGSPMHEYVHLVFMRYRQKLLFVGDLPEALAISEGLSTFWPCTIVDNPHYNRTLYPPQLPKALLDLTNDIQYNPGLTNEDKAKSNKISSFATALWSLREHPRIGKTNAEKIIYEAMAILPHNNPTLADFSGSCSLAKRTLPPQIANSLHNCIEGVFAKHNIASKIGPNIAIFPFLEVENTIPETMAAGQIKTVTITFKNQAPTLQNAPMLISFNPRVNPNVDNPGVRTDYTWGIINPIQPHSLIGVLPGDKIVFTFSIIAPANLGKYACDWAIKLANGTVSYTVSKDVTVLKARL